ncbi:MAG TPA: hypothetical protein VM165_09015, partial [Planctomycetaceae bacterium]|nr:hypothetical protein [Planctomycetaceae bacterium]
MELTVEPVWAWPVVTLVTVGLGALVYVTYRRQADVLPQGSRRLLLGLKLAAVVALLFAMLRPALQFSKTDENSAQLLIAVDVSR